MAAIKSKDNKMISNNCSLSYPSSFSLTYALQLSVSDCVINREAHSLFILVSDLTITYQGRLLQESLITLVPHNCWDFTPDLQRGEHDLITLMILPIGKSGTNEIQYMKYTSEYILKLQIHQHCTPIYYNLSLSPQRFLSFLFAPPSRII